MTKLLTTSFDSFYERIREILEGARIKVYRTANLEMLQACGKGFTKSNLHYMRQFYQKFEKVHALRGELSWTHYRLLLKVDNENAREFYIEQAIQCITDCSWHEKEPV